MVWFYCDDCGDTIKKPKLANHFRSCSSQTFTCVDCSRSFDRHSANAHSTCVSEHEKYALGATKPGGYAAQGFFHEGQAQQVAAAAADSDAVGLEFLSERPPWRCSCCNVNCTSRETLMGHAAGAKHKRRARAAAREAGGGQEQQQQQQNGSAPEPAAAAAGSDKAEQQQKQEQQEQQQDEPPAKKSKKDKKEKKDKKDKTAAEEQQQQQQQQLNGSSADGDQKSKKKSKKSNTAEAVEQPDTPDINTDGQEQQQQQQQERLSAALKVAVKKLKKNGKLGQKKLAKLLQDQDAAGQELLESLKKQLLAVEGVKLEGSKTFTYATQ